MSGIFNFAIVGLERLLGRGKFDDKSAEQIELEYKKRSSPLLVFLEECVERGNKDFWVEKDLLYEHFAKYSAANDLRPMSKEEISKKITAAVSCWAGKKTLVKHGDKKRIPVWFGIQLRNNTDSSDNLDKKAEKSVLTTTLAIDFGNTTAGIEKKSDRSDNVG